MWNLSFELEDGSAVGNTDTVIFNTDGSIASPENVSVSLNWDDGSTSNVDIDISEMTQLGINSEVVNIQQNGFPSGHLIALGFNDDGVLSARYSNDNELAIAKLAISGFVSPENLSPYNTTLFEANGEVGNEYYVDTQGLIVPEAVESSTVNLEEEFARMITVQRAYSLNAQSLTVNDEMLSLLIDLKS
jgi:flagellar hook protein FlgE